MEDLLELNDDNVGVEQDSTAAAPQSKQQPKFNLDDNEDFRKFKSNSQRERDRLANALEAERQARAQQEARLRSIEMQGMDEVQRAKYERDEALAQLQGWQQSAQQQQAQYEWQRNMEEISTETGISIDELNEKAENLQHAWRIGNKYQRENPKGSRKAADDDEDDSRIDDRVALGGGKATPTATRIQQEYNQALEDNDMSGIFKAQEKAHKAGVTLVKRNRR